MNANLARRLQTVAQSIRGRAWPRRCRYASFLLAVCAVAGGCARSRPTTANVPGRNPPAPGNAPAPSTPPNTTNRGGEFPPATPAEPPVFAPGVYVEEGIASWYGVPFHGRAASNGEIFDMNQPVAAHRTLPFGSIVRVTNLTNGEQTEVRIIDRGPFVDGRVIDLSLAAARAIDMVIAGIARVRIELLSVPAPLTGDFTVQVGAYRDRPTAERVRARLVERYPVFIQEGDTSAGHFFRVRVGRVSTQQEAQMLATQLAAEGGYKTLIVRLDINR